MRALIVLGLLSAFACQAETRSDSTKSRSTRYFFTFGSGMLFCKSCNTDFMSASPSTIHGIVWKERYRFGVGTGYNSLGSAGTMPLFGSASVDLFGKRNKFFAEFDYGVAKVWNKQFIEFGLRSIKAPMFVQWAFGYAVNYYKLRITTQFGFQITKIIAKYSYESTYYDFRGRDATYPATHSEVIYNPNRVFINLTVGI